MTLAEEDHIDDSLIPEIKDPSLVNSVSLTSSDVILIALCISVVYLCIRRLWVFTSTTATRVSKQS
jgi:NhaP-type Na+/H+ or K+/H+ antiporter